jgi:hypothetical protein
MKYRSPSRILKLGILSLGLYDLYWLGTTGTELEKITNIRMKSARWLIVVFIGRLASTASIIWIILTLLIDSLSNLQGIAWLLLIITAIFGFAVNSILLSRWLLPYVRAAQLATSGAVQESNAMLLLLTRELYGITILQQAYNNPASMPGFMSRDVPVLAKNLTDNAGQLENPLLKRILTVIAVGMAIGLVLLILFPYVVTHIG